VTNNVTGKRCRPVLTDLVAPPYMSMTIPPPYLLRQVSPLFTLRRTSNWHDSDLACTPHPLPLFNTSSGNFGSLYYNLCPSSVLRVDCSMSCGHGSPITIELCHTAKRDVTQFSESGAVVICLKPQLQGSKTAALWVTPISARNMV